MNSDLLIYPNLKSDCLTPKIVWHQSDNMIFINISLSNVGNYQLTVTSDTLKLSTISNCQKYFIGLKLYGSVIAEKTSHVNIGREIRVCLLKSLKWVFWPRLQFIKRKNLFISSDPSHIFKKFWDDPLAASNEKEDFDSYKKRMNIMNIPPPESSTSNSDSDDEKLIGYD